MVTVPVIGPLEVLVAVKEGIFPVPLAPKPIAVLLLTQVKVVPGTVEFRLKAGTVFPSHGAIFEIAFTLGFGKTTIRMLVSFVHRAAELNTLAVTLATRLSVVVLLAVNAIVAPEPLAGSPMAVLSFVHENVLPPPVLPMVILGEAPSQYDR